METACLLPDGDGVSRASSDVPATVQSGRILKGPPGAGDDTAGRPQELGHVTAGWTERQTDRQEDRLLDVQPVIAAVFDVTSAWL